jgi:glycerol-3-phosphate dehydrogenase
MENVYDVAVIGGGINGCGVAADAALRGLSVVLFEKDDIAGHTSSSSTKLIHGGLRYLEHYNFGMVKKALDERQTLRDLAPHLVHPLKIVLPLNSSMRSPWIVRLGLFLYDHLSFKNKLPKSKLIKKSAVPEYFSPLKSNIDKGFTYFDCTTDDSRLTIENALQAKHHSAKIYTRSSVVSAVTEDGLWQLKVKLANGETTQIKARVVINATGPWVQRINDLLNIPQHHQMALVKGSHIVVKQLYQGNQAYLLQHKDGRVVFVIPYHDKTMIGTTDIPYTDSLDDVHIDEDETAYLLALVNSYFEKSITNKDILSSWSGVRPLLDDKNKSAKALSRDYTFELSSKPAPAISIYGGKITTYRQLANDVVSSLASVFKQLPPTKTNQTPLPGAPKNNLSVDAYAHLLHKQYPWVKEPLLDRYIRLYGAQAEHILSGKSSMGELGVQFGDLAFQAEIDYLVKEEWAVTLEDIIARRTKLGLELSEESLGYIEAYLMSTKEKAEVL